MNDKPVQLRLVEVKNGTYKLSYPNLSVPIEVDQVLFEKFLESDEFIIHDAWKGISVFDHASKDLNTGNTNV